MYTQDQLNFIEEASKHYALSEVVTRFNDKFGTKKSLSALKQVRYRYSIRAKHEIQEVGVEREWRGEIFVKKSNNEWIKKARHIYESAYGESPAFSSVIFADGDNRNFDIDNLILITRSEAKALENQFGDLYRTRHDAEETRTMLNIIRVHNKVKDVSKKEWRRQRGLE